MKRILFFLVGLWAAITVGAAENVEWYDGEHPVSYEVVGKVDPVVEQALRMFCSDMQLVTNRLPVAAKDGTIRIVQGRGSDDGFRLSVSNGKILVEGHNARGTAYGLLELSRLAGVSPWVWWGDVKPYSRSRLTISSDFVMEHVPSVDYRGIFINDEDWSLREWSAKTYEPGQPMGPKTYKALFQLMLRLRANTIWPAMHEGTPGFFTVRGNKEMADSFAIVIGTSHCEPLLRNNVAEWDVKERGPYNYMTNRDEVKRYWAERLKQVRGSEELFTIGMRGIHDGSMEGVKTKEEKLSGLQQVIDDQRELLRKYYNKKVEQVPQVFIPYKEVLEIMESGLRVPDDVTLMWCDDNYGYLTRLPDSLQQQRRGGGGIYYHLSYWGRPHDYLWLTTTQPGLIYHEMKTAYDHNCRRLWIANVHDPKVAAYQLELFLDLAWDIDCIGHDFGHGLTRFNTENRNKPYETVATHAQEDRNKPYETVADHLEHWLMTQFGGVVGRAIAPSMREFYRLCAIRRPEFMGWTQVELDKKKYPGGKSVPEKTEFSWTESLRRMNDFARIEATADVYAHALNDRQRDAYFAHVLYPVHAAAAMTRKMLSDNDKAERRRAYEEISQLTERYNSLGGGKWHGLMSAAPRQLPVFGEVSTQLPQHPSVGLVVARNACDFDRQAVDEGAVSLVDMLGHSMKAVALRKGATLQYSFTSNLEGDATLFVGLVPTHPSDRGDLRVEVSVDGGQPAVVSLKEPFRSEQWKLNVLRCQALKKVPIRLSGEQHGQHRLSIKALDEHIVLDQWMIHLDDHPQFYEIPVKL